MRRALSPKQVTWLMSAALAAGAVVLTTQAGGGPILALHLPVVVVAVALGAGFFFAEQFLVNVEFRRQAHTFTLAGIPLVIGVLVVSPLVFVLTRLVASVLAFVWQRVSVDKMAPTTLRPTPSRRQRTFYLYSSCSALTTAWTCGAPLSSSS